MGSRPLKTRFAPSPTGRLHLGNIRTALFNWLLARRHGGAFLLRLEDTDAMRGHEKYAIALQEDLRWLGLVWDEGPGVGGAHGPYAQSERGEIYKSHFLKLEQDRLAYPCFCTEHELAVERKTAIADHRPPRYSGKCRALSPDDARARFGRGEPATLRFRVPAARKVGFDDKVRGPQVFDSADIGDFVIRRSDGTPAFFFCNAIDDALMGVTLVVRGEDHLTNTPRQIMLLEALGLPAPEYAHIALVVGADGAPLSKRTGSQSVEELRAAGFLPAALHNYLARLGHTYEDNAFLSLETLAAGFAAERLHRAPARFDEAQLKHWQREAVLHAPAENLWAWMDDEVHRLVPAANRDDFIEAVRGNVLSPPDALQWAQALFSTDFNINHAASEAVRAAGAGFFAAALTALEKHGSDFKALTATLKAATGKSGKALFQPLRAALTGELDGPEMVRLLPLMGVERARARLAKYAK
ncbi:MAG: glutamate--tRNA ligase [Gammaproteobacteria bacterium]|nr:glutamate--tRNA ligase [Gammaproteobacteria bacterium]